MVNENDWRLRGQEDYMKNSEGVPDCSDYGYRSLNGRYWVCKECFIDFKNVY